MNGIFFCRNCWQNDNLERKFVEKKRDASHLFSFFYFPVMTIVFYLLWWGDKYLESQQNTFSEQVSNFEARRPQDPDAFF
jgi:hypothetical protein